MLLFFFPEEWALDQNFHYWALQHKVIVTQLDDHFSGE